MTDDRPELTKTEARQGNSRKMNSRALIIGLIGIVILFALVYWFSTATYDETATTTGGGTTIEEAPPAGDDVGSDMEELPVPAPVEEEPATEGATTEAPAETTETPAVQTDTPAETAAPAAP